MKSFWDGHCLKKKVLYGSRSNSRDLSLLKSIHKIFDTVNFSALALILILYFLSFNSQREWTNTYRNLSKTKVNNNNLIDYISKTEDFYINEFESLNEYKKTTPRDLIYLDKIPEKRKNYFNKNIKIILNGFKDSSYQLGY